MRKCILHVTDHEYDRILQRNHDDLVWSNHDQVLLGYLQSLLGRQVAEQVRRYDECRMQKHDDLNGIPRVEEDAAELAGRS
jgi:hypothetical protein